MAQTPEGAEKIAAQFCGVAVEVYRKKRAAGLKRCTKCKRWKSVVEYNRDKSRGDGLAAACRPCQHAMGKANYTPITESERKPRGPAPVAERSGDKLQARAIANRLKKRGKLPDPNSVNCNRCGQ